VIDTSRVPTAQAGTVDPALAFTVLAGIVVGVLFIALGNGYVLLGLDPLYEQITMGAILLAAVVLDAWARTLRGG
jgi:ribose transport system permease protein